MRALPTQPTTPPARPLRRPSPTPMLPRLRPRGPDGKVSPRAKGTAAPTPPQRPPRRPSPSISLPSADEGSATELESWSPSPARAEEIRAAERAASESLSRWTPPCCHRSSPQPLRPTASPRGGAVGHLSAPYALSCLCKVCPGFAHHDDARSQTMSAAMSSALPVQDAGNP